MASVDDIEDLVTSHDLTPHKRQCARSNIMPSPCKHTLQLAAEELQTDSVNPGTQKIWVRTWGSSHNSSDGEYMAGHLAASEYKITGESLYWSAPSQSRRGHVHTGSRMNRAEWSGEDPPLLPRDYG
ncbi:threonylcarbamoyladenosine tRNA methylthiotransferase-like isoform X2 [Carassius auratus]|nr:threonylcarbamoyladenosine tRNA methylthiotransferase-like isoform X2 [Carassius auratus]